MKVTLKDIAEMTGVSLNTVSRALKDKPDIGMETKERIRKVADMLGYAPNLMARGLVLNRSYTIGLVANEMNNPVRSALVEDLRRQLLDNGYQLLVISYRSQGELTRSLQELLARGVDGLILGNIAGILAEMPFWKVLEGAVDKGLPVVAFSQVVSSKVDCIQIDYKGFIKDVTRHFIQKHGYENIVYIGQGSESLRFQGYYETMKEFGLEEHIGLINIEGNLLTSAAEVIDRYLDENGLPQAFVCHNDLLAVGVMSALRKAGYNVPGDVAVTGVDNIDMAEFLNPSLTTVGIDPSSLSEMMIKLIFERLNGDYSGSGRNVAIPGELFFRESCGC